MSSFREIRVYIDDQIAAYAWPFPVVFPGGISPGLHRPVAGLQAFDLREYEIDLSTWLHVLRDGEEHTMRMEVWGIDDSGSAGPNYERVGGDWVLSGKIFVWYPTAEVPVGNNEPSKADNGPSIPNRNTEAVRPDKEYWRAQKREVAKDTEPRVSHLPRKYESKITPLEDG